MFAVANLVEVAMIAAIFLRASGDLATPGSAMYGGFTLVTQLDLPAADGVTGKVAIAATEIAALVILFVGVASLIAAIFQDKVKAVGEWTGTSRFTDRD